MHRTLPACFLVFFLLSGNVAAQETDKYPPSPYPGLPKSGPSGGETAEEENGGGAEQGASPLIDLDYHPWTLAVAVGVGTIYGGGGCNVDYRFAKNLSIMAGVGSAEGETLAGAGVRFYLPSPAENMDVSVHVMGGALAVERTENAYGPDSEKAVGAAAVGVDLSYYFLERFFFNLGFSMVTAASSGEGATGGTIVAGIGYRFDLPESAPGFSRR